MSLWQLIRLETSSRNDGNLRIAEVGRPRRRAPHYLAWAMEAEWVNLASWQCGVTISNPPREVWEPGGAASLPQKEISKAASLPLLKRENRFATS